MRFLILFALLTAFSLTSAAQDKNYFSPLSNTAYPQKAAAILAAPAPHLFSDKKQQKGAEDIVASRNRELADYFNDNRIVADSLLLARCNAVVSKLKSKNPERPFDSIAVFISRSSVPNAASWGEGSLLINLGILLWTDTEDELALLMGHELSHTFLHHFESRVQKNIEILSSDDFKDELNSIRKSKSGKYARFRDLVKDLVTQSGSHSRYKESEADSVGMLMVKRAGYNPDAAATLLLKLGKVDDLFTAPDLYSVRSSFEKTGVGDYLFTAKKKYNGLSQAHVTMNADKAIDSIKTHPDCNTRYAKLTGRPADTASVNCCTHISLPMREIKQRVLVELVRSAYEHENYTLCTHFCLFANSNGFTDGYYSCMLSAAFSGIVGADKHLRKFSVTDAGAPAGSTLKELQDFIFRADNASLSAAADSYLKNAAGASAEEKAFAQLMYDINIKDADRDSEIQKFTKTYPSGKYNYLFKPNSTVK